MGALASSQIASAALLAPVIVGEAPAVAGEPPSVGEHWYWDLGIGSLHGETASIILLVFHPRGALARGHGRILEEKRRLKARRWVYLRGVGGRFRQRALACFGSPSVHEPRPIGSGRFFPEQVSSRPLQSRQK